MTPTRNQIIAECLRTRRTGVKGRKLIMDAKRRLGRCTRAWIDGYVAAKADPQYYDLMRDADYALMEAAENARLQEWQLADAERQRVVREAKERRELAAQIPAVTPETIELPPTWGMVYGKPFGEPITLRPPGPVTPKISDELMPSIQGTPSDALGAAAPKRSWLSRVTGGWLA